MMLMMMMAIILPTSDADVAETRRARGLIACALALWVHHSLLGTQTNTKSMLPSCQIYHVLSLLFFFRFFRYRYSNRRSPSTTVTQPSILYVL
uniref:Putative secreted protein n=1 Tax=Anopheles marajoara TaxID=58244 RepID=A0A2M4C9I3_9DIPT